MTQYNPGMAFCLVIVDRKSFIRHVQVNSTMRGVGREETGRLSSIYWIYKCIYLQWKEKPEGFAYLLYIWLSSIHYLYCLSFWCSAVEAGASPTWRWARGRRHPGQNQTTIHSTVNLESQINLHLRVGGGNPLTQGESMQSPLRQTPAELGFKPGSTGMVPWYSHAPGRACKHPGFVTFTYILFTLRTHLRIWKWCS